MDTQLNVGTVQDVELNAAAWDLHAFDAADVASLYPSWRSMEEITEEGEAMAQRTRQLFQEAKKAKVMEDLTRLGQTPPDFIEQIIDVKQDKILEDREPKAVTDEAAAAAPDECGPAHGETSEDVGASVEAEERLARADIAKTKVPCPPSSTCVCACACVCVRACVRVRVRACVPPGGTESPLLQR
jgi:hypothetical protein